MKQKSFLKHFLLGCFFIQLAVLSVAAQETTFFSTVNGSISATFSSRTASNLIDNNTDTEYSFSGLPNDIIYSSEKAYAVKKVMLTSSSQAVARDPKSVELAGSLDGINWTLLMKASTLNFSERKKTLTISISNPQPFTQFRLRIITVGSGEIGALSEWQLLGEEKTLAAAPTDARAVALGSDSVKILWRDRSDNEDGFIIQRSNNGVDFTNIQRVDANIRSFTDKTVNASSFYLYRVCSVKGLGNSVFSQSNSINTPDFEALTLLTKGRSFTVADQYNNSPAGEDAACAFDNDASTKFLARYSTVWLRINFNEAFEARQYSITSANDSPGRDPMNWTVEGSENGTRWTVIDTRTNQLFDKRFQKRFFTIANPGNYQYFRINVTRNRDNTNLTQFSDWLLYADVAEGNEQITPATPTGFNLENRGYHHVKLSWQDVPNETAYRIERSEDGGQTFTHTYDIPANNTETYPYGLKPETNYVFKLYALNGANPSEAVLTSVTTGRKEFVERFDNLKLWIFDQAVSVRKVKQIGDVAFYLEDKYSLSSINDLYYEFYAQNWEYVFDTYGATLSDPRLHVLLFPMDDGGGLASIMHYRDAPHHLNMVYIKANKSWFTNRSESGYIYDVMAHELCHIVEGVGGGYNGSMFFPIWGDSKWAEIFQYDIFKGLGVSRAESWHKAYTEGATPGGGAEYPNPERVNYWYRDFLYPTYEKYGKTVMLQRFWTLQQQYYRMKNGSFSGTSTNPGGRGNLGEFIHFWSGAAGTNLKSYAQKAFGWNDQYESWLQQARIDYPQITYDEPVADISRRNICLNGGEISSNYTIAGIRYFIDNWSQSYDIIRKKDDLGAFTLTYASPVAASIDSYTLKINDNAAPLSWTLEASFDTNKWTAIDTQDSPVFTNNSFSANLNNLPAYNYFRFVFQFGETAQIRLNEIELWGKEHTSAPFNLRAVKTGDQSVFIDWSCKPDEIAAIEVERSSNAIDFTKIADLDWYTIDLLDALPEAGTYYYRVAVVNKNPLKDKIYSNIAFVNTGTSGVDSPETGSQNLSAVINRLNEYPDNQVTVYNMAGQLILSGNGFSPALKGELTAKLPKGVYLLSIALDKNKTNIVRGKWIIN